VKSFLYWLQQEEGWKSLMAIIYAIICIFDFIVVPSYMGMVQKSQVDMLDLTELVTLDPAVQIQLLKSLVVQHEPFTLRGAGMFHLAFGALLTGSAISKIKGEK
tara:strand:+ start:105 stop:416 length:312 start_codon:yes stop_codon:yes gene_type:complete